MGLRKVDNNILVYIKVKKKEKKNNSITKNIYPPEISVKKNSEEKRKKGENKQTPATAYTVRTVFTTFSFYLLLFPQKDS